LPVQGWADTTREVQRPTRCATFYRPDPSARRSKGVNDKCAPPFCEAEFEIRWGIGIDALSDLPDLGIARGLIDKSGNHLSFAGAQLGNGRERSRETLASSAELQNTLRQAIVAAGPVRPGRRAEAEA
jgi:recombination protein RecA